MKQRAMIYNRNGAPYEGVPGGKNLLLNNGSDLACHGATKVKAKRLLSTQYRYSVPFSG